MTTVPDQARAAFARWRARSSRDPIAQDPHLVRLLCRMGHQHDLPAIQAFAHTCTAELDDLAQQSNLPQNLPTLQRYDGHGRRVEEVVFHPGYHQIGRALYGTEVMARYREPGQEAVTLALMYQLCQLGEAGHACPLACTAGLIKILGLRPDAPAEWLRRLLDPNYDTHFHGSQFLTEVQGGSDVGANAVTATEADDGWWALTGEKWFCSVADAQIFLVTARPTDEPGGTRGLRAFAVPRHLPGGAINGFSIRRLKDKLGTRSMASAEIDFDGAIGWPVGEFKDVVSVVLNTSRLYNAVACCGILQRAWREADGYARERSAFGHPILEFPSVARIVAGLRAAAYGARATTFAMVALADRRALGQSDELDEAGWRALVNLNKYWTSAMATTAARDAIEVFGGNGAIESFSVLPRLLRDGIVVEAWEGGHNVLCAQVLKDSLRTGLHERLFAWLERELTELSPALQAQRERWRAVVSRPDADAHIRDVADGLRGPLMAALLRRAHAADPSDPAEAWAAAHLEITTSRTYDPLDDLTLAERIAGLNSEPAEAVLY